MLLKKILQKLNNVLPRLRKAANTRHYSLGLILGMILVLSYIIFKSGDLAHAAVMELDTSTANQIQIDVANRYRAIVFENQAIRLATIADRAENDSQPDEVVEVSGPLIKEGGVHYDLVTDANRKTTILEATSSRIKIRIEGKFRNESDTAYLNDGSTNLTVSVEYSFTPSGIWATTTTNFQSSGIALDSGNWADGYRVDYFVVDSSVGHSETILYGDGQTESNTSISATYSSNNTYSVFQGTGSYQDIMVGSTDNFWNQSSGSEWNYNIDPEGINENDYLVMSRQGVTPTGLQTASWFLQLHSQSDLDTETKREAFANSIRNPDLPEYITGTTWEDTSANSPSLYFDGAGDYVDIDVAANDITDTGTVTLWINPMDNSKADQFFFSAREGSGERLYLRNNSGNFEVGFVQTYNNDTGYNFAENQWVHVAITWSGTTIYSYINGVATSTPSFTGSSTLNQVTTAAIGTLSSGKTTTAYQFIGLIDELRIYNIQLSQTQIQQDMQKQINPTTSGLASYWRLNENTGTTAHDETTNNNDGTITGATWSTGYVPDHYNQSENTYTIDFADQNQIQFDLDGGANISTLLNGAVTAAATSITVDSTTGFPATGIAYINGDKFSYSGITATTFTGVPSSGDLTLIGHADNAVTALFNRSNPFYKLRNWRSLGLPDNVTLDGNLLTQATDYNASVKPISVASWQQDLTWYSTLQNSTAVTSPDVGSGGTPNGGDYVAGKYGNAARFDAATEAISLPLANINQAKGTADFWYQPNYASTDGVSHNITACIPGTTLSSTEDYSWNIWKSNLNNLIFEYYDYSTSTQYYVNITSSNYRWSANDWVHIRAVWNDSLASDELRLFINNTEPTHTHRNDGSLNVSSLSGIDHCYIGSYDSNSSTHANGNIDEFRIYSEDITPTTLAVGGDTSNSSEYLADDTNDYTFSFTTVDASNRGEYVHFGSDSQFQGLNVDLATIGVGSSPVMTWEYWNGTGWSALSIDSVNSGAENFTASGNFYWTAPGNWFQYSVNGSTDLYYIRGNLASGSYSTAPIENTIKTDILLLNYLGNITSENQTLGINMTGSDEEKGGPPISHWSMDEASSTTAHDNHPESANDLTITNATWVVTSDDYATNHIYLQFDGSGDYLSRVHSGDFDFGADSFTLSGWFRHSSTISGTDYLLANHADAGYKVYMDSSGYLCFGIDADSTWTPTDSVCTTSSLGSLADSRWHHFSAVKTDTTSIKIYIDGNLINTNSSLTATGSLDTDSSFYIGNDTDGGTNGWVGFIDNVFIYGYARSATQVKNDYLNPSTAVQFGK